MVQLLIPDYVLKPSMTISDVENMIATFDGSRY